MITWKRTSLLPRLVCRSWQIAIWYYIQVLHLWIGDELFQINFEFKWKKPATKMSSEFFFQKFVDKILQKHLLCINSELLLYIWFQRFQLKILSFSFQKILFWHKRQYLFVNKIFKVFLGLALHVQPL